MDSEELLRIGFLTELVERDQFQPRINTYRDHIARCDVQAVRSMKRHIDAHRRHCGRRMERGLRQGCVRNVLVVGGDRKTAGELGGSGQQSDL